jgi:hypothetical protein
LERIEMDKFAKAALDGQSEGLRDLLDPVVAEAVWGVTDDDGVISDIATTNCTGFAYDEHEIEEVRIDDGCLVAVVRWSACGDQSPDHPFCGDRINGKADVAVSLDGVVEVRVTESAVDYSGFEPDEPDDRDLDPATPNQRAALLRRGLNPDPDLTRGRANDLLMQATPRQKVFLLRHHR